MTSPATPPIPPLTATQLYGLSQGVLCSGPEQCHWCTAPCKRLGTRLHDDPPPLYLHRWITRARCRNSAYVCEGCWQFNRRSITAVFLGGGLKDRQRPKDHSWLITDQMAWAVLQPKQFVAVHGKAPEGPHPVWGYLLDPDNRFCLALRGEEGDNLLYLAAVNDHVEVLGNTPLVFTHDNLPLTYTVADIEAARTLGESNEPGVRRLIEIFGPPPQKPVPVKDKGGYKPAPTVPGAVGADADFRSQKHLSKVAASGQPKQRA